MLKRLFATRKRPYVPGINRPETIRVDLSGNILTLQMPPHSYYGGFPGEDPPPQVNIYEQGRYVDDSGLPEWQRERESSLNLLRRKWAFYGPPWRTRPYGTLSLSVSVWRCDILPKDMSCFNPNHFEQMALRSLWYAGPGRPSIGEYKAPIHWRLQQESSSTWLYFESHRDYSHDAWQPPEFMRTYRDCYLRIPLDNRYYLNLVFSYLGYAPVKYCLANMNKLRDAVLDSVQLELSATAKERLEEAKRKWPDAHASEHRDPESWVYPKWRYGEDDEEDIVVLKPGSPPPELTP